MSNNKITELQKYIYTMIDEEYDKAIFAQSLWMSSIAKREVQRSRMKLTSSEKTRYELRVVFSRYSFVVRLGFDYPQQKMDTITVTFLQQMNGN